MSLEEIDRGEQKVEVKKKKGRRLRFNGTALKSIGLVFMLVFYISRIVIQNGMMHIGDYTSTELVNLMQSDDAMASLSTIASVMQIIGYMAVPIFTFLLAEGFIHTKNFKKYLVMVLAAALISEVPYDWAVNETFIDWSSQNILFSSAIALITCYGLSQLEQKRGFMPKVGELLIIAAAVLWSLFGRCSFGAGTVLLTAVYYLFRRRNMGRLLIGCAMSMIYYSAPLSSLLLCAYNGERGGKIRKEVFYFIYPVMLLVLGCIAGIAG